MTWLVVGWVQGTVLGMIIGSVVMRRILRG